MKFLLCFLSISIFFLISTDRIAAQTVPERIQQGATFISEGKLDAAEAILEPVIQQDANHGPARFLLGQIAMERHRWKQAEEHLKIAVASNLRRPHLAWELLGRLQLLQHRYSEARASYEESLKQAPDFLPARIGRAQSALFLGDASKVSEDLSAVSDKSPQSAILLSEFLIYSNQDQEALRILNSPGLQGSTFENAAKSLALATSADANADQQLRTALAENLGDPQVYLALAIRDQRHGGRNQSLFEVAYQMDDQNPMPLLFLKKTASAQNMRIPTLTYPDVADKLSSAGQAMNANQFNDALQRVQEILQDRPMHIPAHLIAIEVAEKQKDVWSALESYQTIVEIVPGIPSIEARFAKLAESVEAHDLAECRIRKAIEAEPKNGEHHHLLATILKGKKQIDEALREEELATSLGFDSAVAFETLGNLYYEKMEISKAIISLRKAVEKDPHAIESIASFAVSALTAEDYESLRKTLEFHVQANPENASSLYSLALIYIYEGRLEEAEKYLMQVEKLAPQQQTYYNLAMVQLRLGKTEEGHKAMARFEQIKEEQRLDFESHTQAFKVRMEAQDAFKNKRMEESIRLYSRLLSEKSADPDDLIELAKAYSATKQNADALRIYEIALQASPYMVEALTGASEAARATGKSQDAKIYAAHAAVLTKTCH